MISFIIIFSYIIIYIIKYGIPHSLSETYYKTKYLFSLSLLISTALLIPDAFEKTNENLQFLPFLTFSGILLIAFTPNYKRLKLIDNIHMGSAYLMTCASQIWIAIVNPLLLFGWVYILIYIICNWKNTFIDTIKNTNTIFWSEILMLVLIYIILL